MRRTAFRSTTLPSRPPTVERVDQLIGLRVDLAVAGLFEGAIGIRFGNGARGLPEI